MRRQWRIYADEDPLILQVVLDEAVLYRSVGGPKVIAAAPEIMLAMGLPLDEAG